jgi:hypothetical protein
VFVLQAYALITRYGVRQEVTDFKLVSTNSPETVKTRLEKTIRTGQAPNVVIDARPSGMSEADVRQQITRAEGNTGSLAGKSLSSLLEELPGIDSVN